MPKSEKNPYHNYVKYSSLAIQTGVILFGFAFGGVKLDQYLELSFPVFTVFLTLGGLAIGMYLMLRDISK